MDAMAAREHSPCSIPRRPVLRMDISSIVEKASAANAKPQAIIIPGDVNVVTPNILPHESASAAIGTGAGCQVKTSR